jgi:signal peptidase II
MYHGQTIPILGDFFHLTFVENPGMAFGFDLGISFKFWISLFTLVAGIGLILYLRSIKNQSLSLRLSIAFIIGGAFGNLIDRLFYGVFYGYAPLFFGKVVDFADFDFFNFEIFGRSYDRFPIFNVADSAVTIGVFLLLIFYKKHQQEVEPARIQDAVSASSESVLPDGAGVSSSQEQNNDTLIVIEDGKHNNGEEAKV